MANTSSLTIDYKSLSAIPISSRKQAERMGLFDQMLQGLTPGQIAALFPDYYKDELNALAGQKSEFSKALTGYQSNTSSSTTNSSTNTNGPNATPVKSKQQQEADKKAAEDKKGISPSDFRKIEANPYLAGYADRMGRKVDLSKSDGKYQYKNEKGTLKDNQREAYAAARSEGLSDKAAKALVANMTGESLRNPKDRHWDLKHYSQGIVQWEDTRAERIQQQFGKLPMDMTVSEQTKAAIWEMKNFYKKTYNTLVNPDASTEDMVGILVKDFERPKDTQGAINTRLQFLNDIAKIHEEVEEVKESPSAVPVKDQKVSTVDEFGNIIKSADGKLNPAFESATPVGQDKVPSSDAILDHSLIHEDQINAKGKIRKLPIKQEVKDSLAYAAAKNKVEVEVVSGGQLSEKAGGLQGITRTGSVRHDDGGAADIKLFRRDEKGNKVYLSMNNPEDREIMKQFTIDSVASGMTGVGAGQGYMGSQTIHIGGGTEASWGGADWIGDALEEGKKQRFDLQAWKEEQAKKREEEKEKAKQELLSKKDPMVAEADKLVSGKEEHTEPKIEQTPTPIKTTSSDNMVQDVQSQIQSGEDSLKNNPDIIPVEPKKELPKEKEKEKEKEKKPVPSFSELMDPKPVSTVPKSEETKSEPGNIKETIKETGSWVPDSIKSNAMSWMGKPHTETSNAAGGFISEPHTAINNRTGDIVNLGEKGTGGELIIPRNKIAAEELNKPSEPMEIPNAISKQKSEKPPQVTVVQHPQNNQSVPAERPMVPINHPRISGSLRKAYARATMQGIPQEEGYMYYGHPTF